MCAFKAQCTYVYLHTSSLSLPIKSSSGWATQRLPLLLCSWSSSTSIFSWSSWLCPRLGEWGCDEKMNTSSCRVSWGSDPSLLSQLLQTCRSEDKTGRVEPHTDSAGVGVDMKLSFTGLELKSSRIKKVTREETKRDSFNLCRVKWSLWNRCGCRLECTKSIILE